MSQDFYSTRIVNSTQKKHECAQCERSIALHSRAYYSTGKYEGEFYTQYNHIDCLDAARDYAKLTGCYGEDFPFWHAEDFFDSGPWLKEHYPTVYERIGWLEKEKEFADEDAN